MYLSTSTQPFDKLGDIKEMLRQLKNAGFEAYDYSMFSSCKTGVAFDEDGEEKAREIRRFADEIGIVCNQTHAPFPTFSPYPSWIKDGEEYDKIIFPALVRAIKITGILGGKVCVVHPSNDASPEENAKNYGKLLPYAQESNVKIGVENMWNWEGNYASSAACSNEESFLAHLALLDSEWFVANLDIGHAEMAGLDTSAVKMIKALGARLQSLHIHDNDKWNDNHAIPYTMNVDFDGVCKALKEIGYQGDVTLELCSFQSIPTEVYPALMHYCAEVANHLRKQIM